MSKARGEFVDRVSYVLLWVALGVALICALIVFVNYLRFGDYMYNKVYVSNMLRFGIFTILIFIYRKLKLYKIL